MIRLFRISVPQFIKAYLPPHNRQSNRIKFYTVIAYPFKMMMDEFLTWRAAAITKASVTNETMSLEWYLNELFDTTLRRIYIETASPDGIPAGLEATEVDVYIAAGLEDTEASDYAAIPNVGEDIPFGTAKFAVFIPAALAAQADAITGVVIKYKLAGKSFKVLTF